LHPRTTTKSLPDNGPTSDVYQPQHGLVADKLSVLSNYAQQKSAFDLLQASYDNQAQTLARVESNTEWRLWFWKISGLLFFTSELMVIMAFTWIIGWDVMGS
jgi:maltooligosyltrehalose synthase